MKISLTLNTATAQVQLRRWGGEFRQQVKTAVTRTLQQQAKLVQDDVRAHVASRLDVKRSVFLKGFKARVYDRDPARLPALLVKSAIPWAGIHQSGGVVASSKGKGLLIPLHGRIGRKRFKVMVQELMRGGNAFFVKNKRGQIILMAENIREHDKVLSGPKRRYRKAAGVSRLKRGADVPIAVLVPRVQLRSRIDVTGAVMDTVPKLAIAIEKSLLGLGR
ncbi:DUF6441 family protein [Ottowia testudinis]|uniref:Minor tail protein Z (GPZ) n=1 Tax=Ottowia testudinis TaxID=2816950 RepID=A0A975H5I4_9BURK|nr:DUF6441 family protein [Ottowia testudinis]QTD44972.1 hypothetical protein J1M35_18290 [Ottowia testudinis]